MIINLNNTFLLFQVSFMKCDKNKADCCSSEKSDLHGFRDDPEMLAMYATGAILVTGFLVISFVSGPYGLLITLALLSALGLFYAIKGS
jgi:hypothetical protein